MNAEKKDGLEILDHYRVNVPTIPQMFYNTVHNADSQPANTFKSGKEWKTINYSEWAKISEEIAISLIQHGVKKGDKVCIMSRLCAQRGWTDIAILLTGAISTTVTTLAADKELIYIINQSDIKYLFAEDTIILNRIKSLWDKLPSLRGIICMEAGYDGNKTNIWSLDEFRADGRGTSLQSSDLVNYWQSLTPDDIARIDYTSGSTCRINYSEIKHGEWNKWEQQDYNKILLENLKGNYNNIFTTILTMGSIKERTTGFFSMIAIGALIKYGSGSSEIKNLLEIKNLCQTETN